MNILVIGDIVGKVGFTKLKEELPRLREENEIDFVIVNGENIAEGMGMTEKNYRDLLALDVDVITMGNHTWAKKDIFKFINEEHIIRPANYPKGVPGVGYRIYNCKGKKICVINLLGRAEINVLTENPFQQVSKIIKKVEVEDNVDIIIVDFHAEASAEKRAMGYYLDGKVNIVFGTHTHIQTADEQVLPNGTGYITDVGMTGPKHSVIGMETEASIKRFVTALPEKYKIASGEAMLNAVVFKLNDENCRIESINRISC